MPLGLDVCTLIGCLLLFLKWKQIQFSFEAAKLLTRLFFVFCRRSKWENILCTTFSSSSLRLTEGGEEKEKKTPEEREKAREEGKVFPALRRLGEMTINFSGLSKTAEQWNYLTICMHFCLLLPPPQTSQQTDGGAMFDGRWKKYEFHRTWGILQRRRQKKITLRFRLTFIGSAKSSPSNVMKTWGWGGSANFITHFHTLLKSLEMDRKATRRNDEGKLGHHERKAKM